MPSSLKPTAWRKYQLAAQRLAPKMRMKRAKIADKDVARGARRKISVYKGNKQITGGGLKKTGLKKNKNGKVVSAKASAQSKKRNGKRMTKWGEQVKKARENLKIEGFCPIGGKTKEGKALLAEVHKVKAKL